MLRNVGNSGPEEARAQSSRADALLGEFETSGKGWFWETGREGKLCDISDSVARALGREPDDLIDRPFTDLISSENSDGAAAPWGRGLGVYLAAHVAVNDTLGHPAGDTLLRLVALRLRDVIGKAGQVGRLGGDEFEIVLPSTSDKSELSKLAQGIIDSLSRPYTINGTAVSIGASVGIVTSDYDDRTSDDLMRDADLALYAAKAAGKGCFRFFEAEMHDAARQRQLMESDLRVALENSQFYLLYQPCVDASSEAVTGFEALIRWEHPERGPISPVEFIPLAEEFGLINEIGEWVLR